MPNLFSSINIAKFQKNYTLNRSTCSIYSFFFLGNQTESQLEREENLIFDEIKKKKTHKGTRFASEIREEVIMKKMSDEKSRNCKGKKTGPGLPLKLERKWSRRRWAMRKVGIVVLSWSSSVSCWTPNRLVSLRISSFSQLGWLLLYFWGWKLMTAM